VDFLRSAFGGFDSQLVLYVVVALIPNLFLILWAMARLSRELGVLKAKSAMMEDDINLLDQAISSLSAELQTARKSDKSAGEPAQQDRESV
jgi:hypothetical protein